MSPSLVEYGSLDLSRIGKVRCRVLDQRSGEPIGGVVVHLALELGDGEIRARLPVSALCSDRTGYLSFDLQPLIDAGVSPVGALLVSAPQLDIKDKDLLGELVRAAGAGGSGTPVSGRAAGLLLHSRGDVVSDSGSLNLVFPIWADKAKVECAGWTTPGLPAVHSTSSRRLRPRRFERPPSWPGSATRASSRRSSDPTGRKGGHVPMNAPVKTRTRLAAVALAVVGGLILVVTAAGETGSTDEFAVPTANSQPLSIVSGPDRNIWFTEFLGNKIARMTPEGAVTEFPIPTTDSRPDEIDVGPDGNLWFAEVLGNKIARITPAGAITEFLVPTPGSRPTVIAPGPDGNLWFSERGAAATPGNKIGRITPSGAITEFALPNAGSRPLGVTAGPDGNVWFTEQAGNRIGRIDPATGSISEFPLPQAGSAPFEITLGPDGNLWFTEFSGNRIGRITPDGAITEFPLPGPGRGPNTIRRGPDPNAAKDCAFQRQTLGAAAFAQRYGTFGNCIAQLATTQTLWFTETLGNAIGQITTNGVVFEYAIPTAAAAPIGIAEGPDGAVWFAENGANKIGRLAVQNVRQPAGPGVRARDSAEPASVNATVDPD